MQAVVAFMVFVEVGREAGADAIVLLAVAQLSRVHEFGDFVEGRGHGLKEDGLVGGRSGDQGVALSSARAVRMNAATE